MNLANSDSRLKPRQIAQRLGLRSFWEWWTGQLVPLLPAGPRNAMRRRRLRPILAFDVDAAVLSVPAASNGDLGYKELARIPLTGDATAIAKAGRAAIDALPKFAYGGTSTEPDVLVALPPIQVLRKTITLPAAVEENLQQALAYDLDRHTPFKPEEMSFDAVVIARNPAKKEIRVDWAAALRSVVDQARRRAESWGATVLGVTPDSPERVAARGGSTLNLIGAAERANRSLWRRGLWAPLALLGVLAVVAIAIPIWQKRSHVIALTRVTEEARLQADASAALRDQLERLTGDYNFALQKKYAFPSTLQLIDDVTKLLPDDTWLTQLEVKGTLRGKEPRREILVRGESANAGRLVSLLEDSKLFEEAAPRSPTTKIQPGPGEIFDLGAQLKALPPPAMIPAESVPAPTRPAPPIQAAAPPRPGATAGATPPQPPIAGATAPPGAAAAAPAGAAASAVPPGAIAPQPPAPAPLAGAATPPAPAPLAGAATPPAPGPPAGAPGAPGALPPATDAVAPPPSGSSDVAPPTAGAEPLAAPPGAAPRTAGSRQPGTPVWGGGLGSGTRPPPKARGGFVQ
jgi:general secretion pathway protein L